MASLVALGSGLAGTTRAIFTFGMVIARCKAVCTAPVMVSEFVTSHKSVLLEIVPCSSWETTIAPETTCEATASEEVLSGHTCLDGLS